MRCKPSEDVCLAHGRPLATATACEANCPHRKTEQHNDSVMIGGKIRIVKQLRCVCGTQISLGKANDKDPRVQIEKRAAEHAAERVGGSGAFADTIVLSLTLHEAMGYELHALDCPPVINRDAPSMEFRGWQAERWVGWLLREIAISGVQP